MAGRIGLNQDKLHTDLERYKISIQVVSAEISKTSRNFFDGLKDKWASPDAYLKSHEWICKLGDIRANLLNDCAVSMDIVEDAAGYIAKSLGDSYERIGADIGMDYGGVTLYLNESRCLEAFSDGTVAMDVNAVKLLLDLFNQGIDEVYSLMDAVSDSINIYDANGDIQNGHSCKIKEIKQELTDEVKAINTELQSYMDQYITGVENAKAQAASGF